MAQDDIKRMLAYSTISQIGFMFFAAGIRAYGIAIFFLVAHAFFKALLFLCAGSVIHGLHDEQDMMKMGGLRRTMPFTTWMWVIGWLAIAGIPPFVGFFAKDQDLTAAALDGRWVLWAAALTAAAQTAVYMTRGTFMTFFGRPRHDVEPHEPATVMRVPIALLGVATVLGGLLNLTDENGLIDRFLRPFVPTLEGSGGLSNAAGEAIAVVVAVTFTVFAYFVYGSGRMDWIALRVRLAGARRVLGAGFYVDDVYGAVFGQTGKLGATFLAYVVDRRLIDGFWTGLAGLVGLASSGARRAQAGLVRVYAAFIFLGVVALLAYLAVRASS
jgi:NADH-quinone oxidoreductase subunit L